MPDSPTLYRHVIADAWRLSWRHKFLWIYGFFASVLASGGVYDVIYRGWNDATVRRIFRTLPDASLPSIPAALNSAWKTSGLAFPPLWAIAALAVAIIVGAALLWASVISQGALISAGGALRRGKTPDSRDVFRAGLARFWPVLGINFLSRFLSAVALFLTALPVGALLLEQSPRAAILYIISFLAFVPFALIVALLTFFALAAVVVEKLPFLRALTSAWATFSRHWLVSLEMAFVILAIDILMAVAVVIGLFVLILPFAFLLLMVQLVGTKVSLLLVLVLAAIALLSFIIAAGSFTSTFRYAAWTALYLRLEERGGTPKIIRLIRAIPHYLHH